MIVVADSSPLGYLILIEHTHVLPSLYGRVLIPPGVSDELRQQ
jgi:predicted nucleic acid-binding protein